MEKFPYTYILKTKENLMFIYTQLINTMKYVFFTILTILCLFTMVNVSLATTPTIVDMTDTRYVDVCRVININDTTIICTANDKERALNIYMLNYEVRTSDKHSTKICVNTKIYLTNGKLDNEYGISPLDWDITKVVTTNNLAVRYYINNKYTMDKLNSLSNQVTSDLDYNTSMMLQKVFRKIARNLNSKITPYQIEDLRVMVHYDNCDRLKPELEKLQTILDNK